MNTKIYSGLLFILSLQLFLLAQDNTSILLNNDQLLITTQSRIPFDESMTEGDAVLLAEAYARHAILNRAVHYLFKNDVLSMSFGSVRDISAQAFDLMMIQKEPLQKVYYHGNPYLSLKLMVSINIPSLKNRLSFVRKQRLIIHAYRSELNRTEMLIRKLNLVFSDSLELNQSLIDAFRASEWLLKGIETRNVATKIQHLDQAIKLDPEYAHARYLRGKALYFMQVYENAIKDYNWLIQNHQNWWEVYHLRGLTRGQLGQYEQALEDYQTMLADVQYMPAQVNRGVIFCKMGEYEKAMADYKKVLQLDPNFITVHYNMACLYALKGDSAAALSTLELAIEKGYRDIESIRQDEDLKLISDTEPFKALLEKYKKSAF